MVKITTGIPRLQMAGMHLNKVCMVLIYFKVPHRDYDSLNSPFENIEKLKEKTKQNGRKTTKRSSKEVKTENQPFIGTKCI